MYKTAKLLCMTIPKRDLHNILLVFLDELELTGSPLKLDLSLHAILDDTLISDDPQLWKKEEGGHAPICVETARCVYVLH